MQSVPLLHGCKCICSCASCQQLLAGSPVSSGSDSMFLMALIFLGSVTRPEGVSDTWNSAAAETWALLVIQMCQNMKQTMSGLLIVLVCR
jgi:hypothetical protein